MFCSCGTITQVSCISRGAGKMLLDTKGTPHFGSCPESVLGITAASPTSVWPEVIRIWYQISVWDLMVTLLASSEKGGVRGEEEEKGQAGLTSCSESPSMISDTSCSLRAADMESPPLPLCPTLLGECSGTLRH